MAITPVNDRKIVTTVDLDRCLTELGVEEGHDVMVHSSMSSLGFVLNGANDIIDTLLKKVGSSGTILMPGHSGQITDPSEWSNPAIYKSDIERVKKFIRPFDTRTTPVRNRGVVPEVFMLYSGTKRSSHPISSIMANGAGADRYIKDHALNESEGIKSPVGKLYTRSNGHVLLLGVSFDVCTALHLCEFLMDVPYLYYEHENPTVLQVREGEKKYIKLKRYPKTSKYFNKVEQLQEIRSLIKTTKLNNAKITYFKLKPVVDFVCEQIKINSFYLIEA